MNIREFSQDLLKLYQEMADEFSTFQKSTGLNCLEGCGRCCLNPEVEASVLEMIPLALKIHDENKLEYWLAKLESVDLSTCILYQAHSPDKTKGNCGSYHERPSVCRMFGVSGYFNKYQELNLSVCKYIKDERPELLQKVIAQSHEKNTPMLIQWSYRLAQLSPELIQDKLPVSLAIKKALEKVALYAQYQEGSSDKMD